MTEITLTEFNALPEDRAQAQALYFCGCLAWADALVDARPYDTVDALLTTATLRWQEAPEEERLEAFAAHPKIGDVEYLRQKFAGTARAEQGQVIGAADDVLHALAELNRVYFDRHGFIFIICASGKSAEEMLLSLKGRLDNATPVEIDNASREQEKIMALRIAQTFNAE